jgi:hypothetical protein
MTFRAAQHHVALVQWCAAVLQLNDMIAINPDRSALDVMRRPAVFASPAAELYQTTRERSLLRLIIELVAAFRRSRDAFHRRRAEPINRRGRQPYVLPTHLCISGWSRLMTAAR